MASKANKMASSGTPQLILDVRTPTSASSTASGVIVYSAQDSSGELAQYAANYSATTGIYTVPVGGHKNVKIKVRNFPTRGTVAGMVQTSIQINGVNRALMQQYVPILNAMVSQIFEYDVKNLSAGDTVKIYGNSADSGGLSASAQPYDGFQIFSTQ